LPALQSQGHALNKITLKHWQQWQVYSLLLSSCSALLSVPRHMGAGAGCLLGGSELLGPACKQ
jgi:hypothetical protein